MTNRAAAEISEAPEAPIVEVPRRTVRKATRAASQEPSAPAQPGAANPTRRVRKPASEVVEPPATRKGRKTPTTVEEPAPIKRTVRKATVKDEKEDKAALDPPARRARPNKATNVSGPSGLDKSDTAKRSTARIRVTKTTPIDHSKDDGSDPLDTFKVPDQDTAEDPLPAAAPTQPDTKARKPRTAVKQEEATEVLKAGRGRSTSTKTPAPPAPARGRPRKTPATAPAATQTVDKENTPGTHATTGSSTKSLTGEADEGVVVKVRATRKKTATVKQEGEEVTVVTQPKPRATRATRARTKTT